MRYDTAGNQIIEQIQDCDCGLTGGCEKCNPILWKSQKMEEIRKWRDKFNKDMEKRKKMNKEIKEKIIILACFLGIAVVGFLVISGITYWAKIFRILN